MMRIEATSFSLRSVLHAINTMFRPKAEEKQLQLSVTIGDDVPDILYGDVVRLTQVLVNLTSNAIKFTSEGAVRIHVAKTWGEENAVRILFTVSDTGIGIEPSKQQSIFDRFNQAEAATTRKYGGTGLGLTIVKQLIELQNGFISVESKPGEGATFKVELPYTLGEPLQEEGTNYLTENDQLPPHPDVRLLVAEDNRMNQNLLRHLLGSWQLQYKMVNNGKEVLQALERQHYDLVLMDIQMPEMDGYTAVQAIRNELQSTIPVIAMTAHAMAGEREKCLQMGMNEYISKPIIEDDLYRMIQVYIGKLPPRELPAVHHQPGENGVHHLINLHYLHELSKGNTQFEKTMLEQFIAQLPEELSLLKQAVVTEDIAAIRATAHNLKTTVSFIGLQDHLYPVLEPLEKLQENSYHSGMVTNQFNTLKQLCIQAVQEAIHILL